MKRILFLMNSLSTGGAEKVLVNILNYLSREKYEIDFYTVFNNSSESNELTPDIERKCIVKSDNKYIQAICYKIFSKILSANTLYRLMIKNTYDIEIAFLEGLPTKIISGSSQTDSKKIAWVHVDLEKFRGSDYCYRDDGMQISCYKVFDEIISVSQGVKNAFEKRFGNDLYTKVIYNPIDEKEIITKSKVPISGCMPFKSKAFRFIAVGRLHPQKGYERLIAACDILRKNGKDIELCIVGDGTEKHKLLELIKTRELSDIIHLYGYSANPYQLIKEADAMVLSSYAEGFPLVSVEALILGIPVVATAVTGPMEVLENGKWGILTQDSAEGIAGGMEKIMDKEMYDKYKNLALIRGKQFCVKNSMKEIEKLLDEN